MEKFAKYSIIIPVYNVESYLTKCVDSVLEQNYKNYEIILIDDGSTDESGNICDEYANKGNCVTVIHQNNQGLSAARNRGIDNAQGEYIIFLDSDDYWSSDSVLSIINSRLNKSHAEVLSFNYKKFSGEIFEKPYFQQIENMPLEIAGKKSLEYQIKNNLWIACAWNKVIKKELFNNRKLRFNIGITSEDIDWCLRLALQAESFDFIADILVCYRQRITSISQSITVKKIDTLIDNIENCLLLIEREENIEKIKALKPYIGYQYGTAIYLVALINDKEESNRLLNRLCEKAYILKWSKNRKIRMIQIVKNVGGINLVIFMLKIRNRMR